MQWSPHVTVATVIEQQGKFLLVEEHAETGLVLNQPAGHLEANETLIQAAKRETYEETGWQVEIQGIVGVALYTSPLNKVTYHRTTFHATAVTHNSALMLDDGIVRAIWMTYDEMQQASARMRSQLVLKSVEQYLHGHRYPLDMIF
jgi:ADP-ribose pyrophosphatase YjhB (NUDIX family)